MTGALARGTIRQGERLLLSPKGTEVRVRGLQSLGKSAGEVSAVARVAVNLRGVDVHQIHRGNALVTPSAWAPSREVDIRLSAIDPSDLPGDLVLHIGSAAVSCRVRPLGEDTARLLLSTALPLEPGDRAVLREPSNRLVTGFVVLDVDPPPLRRRGAARIRADQLKDATGVPDPRVEIARRGTITRGHLAALGILSMDAPVPEGLRQVGDHLVDTDSWARWGQNLADAVDAHHTAKPLEAGLSVEAARRWLGLADIRLVEALVRDSVGRLTARSGRVARPGSGPSFSEETGRALDDIRQRLERDPLAAPEAQELAAAGLTKSVLAAAVTAGLVLRLPGEVILHPSAPERAMATIAQLDQPFTLSQARHRTRHHPPGGRPTVGAPRCDRAHRTR